MPQVYSDSCGCIRCYENKSNKAKSAGWKGFMMLPGFRYACEICGNKRCPHHTDHDLKCTNSNDSGQQGSI